MPPSTTTPPTSPRASPLILFHSASIALDIKARPSTPDWQNMDHWHALVAKGDGKVDVGIPIPYSEG